MSARGRWRGERLRGPGACVTLLGLAVLAVFAALDVRADPTRDARALRCAEIAENAARLDCYDAEYRTPRAPGERFGLESRDLRASETTSSVRARIAKVEALRDGALRVTLDNDQVWLQIDDRGWARWRAGDEMVIERGALGSFLASTSVSRRQVRVRRER
jgi:hypothetical protein